MFTGLIETQGLIERLQREGNLLTVGIKAASWTASIPPQPGESVAVNGICLTVVVQQERGFLVQAVLETAGRTTIGDWRAGDLVNLERALPAGGRLDGHFVTGHVDGTARIVSASPEAGGLRVRVQPSDRGLLRLIAEKGSVALDGISLTVAGVRDDGFAVAVIPYTLEHTTVKTWRAGIRINLETDLIAKYVERLTARVDGGIRVEKLREEGFQ